MQLGKFARRTGPALAPICMSKSLFNATLRDGQADGLSVDAIPSIKETRKWKPRQRFFALPIRSQVLYPAPAKGASEGQVIIL